MGDIILFNPTRKKMNSKISAEKKEFDDYVQQIQESDDFDASAFMSAMEKLTDSVLDDKDKKIDFQLEKQKMNNFIDRYSQVFKNQPLFHAGERMQYFAQMLLNLVPEIFHNNGWFGEPFDDFSYFYDFFDGAFADFSAIYAEYDNDFESTMDFTDDTDVLEKEIVTCLNNIISLDIINNNEDKIQIIKYGYQMFELYRNMLYYHTGEM